RATTTGCGRSGKSGGAAAGGRRIAKASPSSVRMRGARNLPRRRDGILLIADVLEPLHVLAVERLLQRDMDHPGARPGAVPMLLARWNPDRVAGADFVDRSAPGLHAPRSGDDVQRLAERMGVPGGARARLEAHARPADARWRR